MSEYIVDGAVPNHTVLVEDEREVYWHMTHLPVREEVVRCRDCRWCMAYSKVAYCDQFAHALPTAVALLDGFCAWGERRDA